MRVAPGSIFSIEHRMRTIECPEFIYCIPLFSETADAEKFTDILHEHQHVDFITSKYVALFILTDDQDVCHGRRNLEDSQPFERYILSEKQSGQNASNKIMSRNHIRESIKICKYLDISPRSMPALLCMIRGYPSPIIFDNLDFSKNDIYDILLDLREIAESYKNSDAVNFDKLLYFKESILKIESWDFEISKRKRGAKKHITRLLRRRTDLSKLEIEILASEASEFGLGNTASYSVNEFKKYLTPKEASDLSIKIEHARDLLEKKNALLEDIAIRGESLSRLNPDNCEGRLGKLYDDIEKLSLKAKKLPPKIRNPKHYANINWSSKIAFSETMSSIIINTHQIIKMLL